MVLSWLKHKTTDFISRVRGQGAPSEVEHRPGTEFTEKELAELHAKSKLNENALRHNDGVCPECGGDIREDHGNSARVTTQGEEVTVGEEMSAEPGGVGVSANLEGSESTDQSVEAGVQRPVFTCTNDGSLTGNQCTRYLSNPEVDGAAYARENGIYDSEYMDKAREDVAVDGELEKVQNRHSLANEQDLSAAEAGGEEAEELAEEVSETAEETAETAEDVNSVDYSTSS